MGLYEGGLRKPMDFTILTFVNRFSLNKYHWQFASKMWKRHCNWKTCRIIIIRFCHLYITNLINKNWTLWLFWVENHVNRNWNWNKSILSFTISILQYQLWQKYLLYAIFNIQHLYSMPAMHISKREVPRGVRNSKVRRQDKFRRDWSRHQNTCKSQSGTGPGVRRSKRPLSACHTRCK